MKSLLAGIVFRSFEVGEGHRCFLTGHNFVCGDRKDFEKLQIRRKSNPMTNLRVANKISSNPTLTKTRRRQPKIHCLLIR